jgi:signal transduction histidine kinase/DNA-binding response OmpR family regulator
MSSEDVRAHQPRGALRVIVVEDNPDDAALLLRELRRGNYNPQPELVDTLEGLEAALQQKNAAWDIVISDWSLPTFNGLAGFRMVREMGLDLPFIIVSGTIGEEHAVEALKAGVNDFMTKGRWARLIPAIERELREAEIRKQKKLAEHDLEKQRVELESSERLLRSVLQTVPDGVVVVDRTGKVIVWSAGTESVLRMPKTDLPLDWWSSHYGFYLPDRTTLVPSSDIALALALSGNAVDSQELFLRNEGAPKGAWLSVSGRPLRSADGRTITGAVAVFRDVTKEKSAQEHLMIADRMASVGMLAAGVAHEINNPLGAALLNLELVNEMLAQPQPSEQQSREREQQRELQESIGDARSAVARVREIVGDLRIFSRHEDRAAGDRADVREALESSLRMAFNEIRHRAQVIRDYSDAPLVKGSEGRLGQVFLNLIVNAAQAISEGNTEANTIKVSTRTNEAGWAIVEVTDTGAGIKPEDIPNLFTPFFTTKPPGIGTGLGLPICQRIIQQMGGEIDVESELGKGATFRVSLPPAQTPTTEARPVKASMRSRAPISQRRGRVLVVDDEPMLASAIRRVLISQHDVDTTTRAVDALDKLRTGAMFDVIFADLMMPQVTGMELYARICEEFPDHGPRVVFLTGGAFTQAAREFLAAVPNRTLEKPIDREGLLALVSERVRAPSIPPR